MDIFKIILIAFFLLHFATAFLLNYAFDTPQLWKNRDDIFGNYNSGSRNGNNNNNEIVLFPDIKVGPKSPWG